MLRTLYSRLALTLFVLLCVMGVILIQLIGHSSTQYQQEVAQKLNRELAAHIVAEQPLVKNHQVDDQALDHLFHQLMVINPSIELYLLDRQGLVLDYFAPEGKVRRTRISLEPVRRFLDKDTRFPIEGDDPRNPDDKKVFSAAEIFNEAGLQGYLYVVLGGERYDNVLQMVKNSHILESSLNVLLVALAAALLCGLIVFALLTRRLRVLGGAMRRYTEQGRLGEESGPFPGRECVNDEVDELGRHFKSMAEKIDVQIRELKKMDNLRREMVANVSHDLRTPLTTMRGYLETLLLKREALTDEEREQYLTTALLQSERLGHLVEELFELARLDSCESVLYSEPFSMGELVQDVSQAYHLRAQEKSIRMEVSLNPDVPMIYGDIAMMQRVLENLLENGLRHTPTGGRISISVDVDSAHVVVRVSDTGNGIPAADLPRIFERFYQQDVNREDSNGAGLGLAIAQRIIDLHGSAIKVQSELNRGTTFSFQLSASPAA